MLKLVSDKRSYRRRVKASKCRGKKSRACKGTSGCKFVTKKRRFCRKSRNTKRYRYGGSRRR